MRFDPRTGMVVDAPQRDMVTLTTLALELVQIGEDLARWAPLTQRLEQLGDSMRGGDGVTRRDINRLRRWARRWSTLHPDLRAFHRAHLGEGWAGRSLWRILEAGGPLSGPDVGASRRAWEEWRGSPPPFELCPRMRQTD